MHKYIRLKSLSFYEVEGYLEDATDVLVGRIFNFEVELLNFWRKSEGMTTH